MNKKELISGGLAGIMAVSVIPTTVGATTNSDALYKAAHTATIKAMKTKDQGDINTAREAIKALPENLGWAKGEFSKQLDKVQQPILKAIVNAVNVASAPGGLTQANINVITKAIPNDLPEQFKASYTSARDNLQIKFQNKVVSAVKLAEQKVTSETKVAAQVLVNELKTALSKNIVKVANEVLQVRLDAIVLEEVKDIKITNVSKFNKNSITIEFEKLEKDLNEAIVEVKSPNGKIIEVKPLKLQNGQKVATFEFIEPIEGKIKVGAWTVDDVKFNGLNIYFLDTFATLKNDDIEGMGKLLKDYEIDLGIGNIVHSKTYYEAYLNAPNRDKVANMKDVQNIINDGNWEITDSNTSSDELTPQELSLLQAIVDSNGESEKLFIALKNAGCNVGVGNKEDYVSDYFESEYNRYVRDSESILSLAKEGLSKNEYNKYALDNVKKFVDIINVKANISKDESIEKIKSKIDLAVQSLLTIKDNDGKIKEVLIDSYDYDPEDIVYRSIYVSIQRYKNLSNERKIEVIETLKYSNRFNSNLDKVKNLFDEFDYSLRQWEDVYSVKLAGSTGLNDIFPYLDSVTKCLTIVNGGKEVSKITAIRFIKLRAEKYEIKTGPDTGKGTFETFEQIREVLRKALADNSKESIFELIIASSKEDLTKTLKDCGFKVKENHDYNLKIVKGITPLDWGAIDLVGLAKNAEYVDSTYGVENIQKVIDAIDLVYLFNQQKTDEELVDTLDKITKIITDIKVAESPSYTSEQMDTFIDYSNLSDSERKDIAYLVIKYHNADGLYLLVKGINRCEEVIENIFNETSDISLNAKKIKDYNKIAKVLTVINNEVTVSVRDAIKFIESRPENESGCGTLKSFDEVRSILDCITSS